MDYSFYWTRYSKQENQAYCEVTTGAYLSEENSGKLFYCGTMALELIIVQWPLCRELETIISTVSVTIISLI